MGMDPSAKFLPAHSKRRQEVAAVCYRIRRGGIEFLLVQTRSGRWIFPKGGVERGLTPAQSAALEAFEEAGVHGRIEEIPFARYLRRKADTTTLAKSRRRAAPPNLQPSLAVTTHLCEVSHLEPPQESNRSPTWFSADKAKQRLRKGRVPEFGAELARIVDRASARIWRLHRTDASSAVPARKDALQEVRFEASEIARVPPGSPTYDRYIRREGPGAGSASARSVETGVSGGPLFPALGSGVPLGSNRPTLRLGNGTACSIDTSRKVQVIDEVGSTSGARVLARSTKNRRK
jgi:8-oxo-dGTP pyrophosphatase MutT (NUDIX family)